jgi:8-oxo-dGTP diphosphatase
MSDAKKIGVGFGVMVLNDEGQILLGHRNDDGEKADSALHGEGTWTMPGGKLEYGETFEEGAAREVKEETSLTVKNLRVIGLNNDLNEFAHFVTVGLLANDWSGSVQTMEPDEITEWRWFDLDKLPAKIYPPSAKFIEKYQKNEFYIEGQ